MLKLPEKFICRMFKSFCDNARVVMFGKCRVPEALPPTYKYAPQLHIQRAHYQSMVWMQATCNIPLLPPQPETMGWSKGNGTLVPTVMTLAQMCRSYHMRMHQMMHLREMWLQNRKHALHKIVQVQSLSRV